MSPPKFGQAECANYLKRCESQEQVEDVLTAYLYTKFVKGCNSAQVLRKLYLLVCYLKASRQLDTLERFPRALSIVQYHLQFLSGGAIGARPTTNALANEVWNHARRITPPTRRSRSTPTEGASEWGALGPGAVIGMESQRRRSMEDLTRVTSLEPDEVAMLGPRQAPSYHTLTLPPYGAQNAIVPVSHSIPAGAQ